MPHISDSDPIQLSLLLQEMTKTYQALRGWPIMLVEADTDDNVRILQQRVLSLAESIYDLTDSTELKSIVNSVLDTMSVEDTISHLKAFNAGNSMWMEKFAEGE